LAERGEDSSFRAKRDRHARQQQVIGEARLELRRQHAKSWAEEIRSECQALSRVVLPKSALAQAVA